jgi:truncated hemoglobin YjbI
MPACGDDGTATTESASETTDGTGTTTDDTTTAAPTSDPPTTSTTVEPTSTTTTTETATDPLTGTTTTSDTDTTTGEPANLCERLGGEVGVGELVDGALGVVLSDDKVNGYFLNSDVDGGNLRTCLIKQLGAVAGCAGVEYDCLDMKAAHAGLGISTADFMDFALDFSTALDAHQGAHPDLSDDDKTAILTILGDLAPDIVEDANNDLTVYQRVGRKPAIKGLVGAPGQAGSFVDNVANDAAINGFFGATDFERLNTCLTRQVGGIDGPTKYGLEVDAPDGVDPGVGAGAACKTMAEVHAGLLDANDSVGIDINDFGALVADLVTAMEAAGVAATDQEAILAVLGPMCEDILAPEFRNQCPGANKVETVEALDLALPILDDGYDASLASMACAVLDVPDDGIDFVGSVAVTLAADHTFVGDLVVKIQGPDGTLSTLLSRPGLAEGVDGQGECCGDNANINQSMPLTFKNGGATDAEQLGAALPNTGDIVCVNEQPPIACEFHPNPGAGPGMDLDDFLGLVANGTWRVCIGDAGGGDAGTLHGVTLVIDKVKYDPTP